MFGKWFDSAYTGSMAGSGADVFAVWTYAIAKSDRDGYVELNPLVVAALIGMPVESVEKAIKFLQQPDPKSRNPDHEGRRLIYQSGHLYLMVSKPIYGKRLDTDERREYLRVKQRESRAGRSNYAAGYRSNYAAGYVYYAQGPIGIRIGFSRNPWARVNEMRSFAPDAQLLATEKATPQTEKDRHQQFAADRIEREYFKPSENLLGHIRTLLRDVVATPTTSTTSTHTDIDKDKEKNISDATHPHPTKGGEQKLCPEEIIYQQYPRKLGKDAAIRAIKKAVERIQKGGNGNQPISDERSAQLWLYGRVKAYANSPAGTRADKEHVPYPATWFNAGHYRDDPKEWQIAGGQNGKSNAQAAQARTHNAFEQARLPRVDFEGTGEDRALAGGGGDDGEDRFDGG